ncbi:hypothetical protein [Vibrio splendidus]|uniref:hypothetical protein n=1 Tax=Vibrio splendidus TaxID=29497 RepID=UPI000C825247|nr:hypothetical protein [Vibrio splendidus]PMI54242.1 hypothetical protein BCU42_18535 [Vibrio splendidus]
MKNILKFIAIVLAVKAVFFIITPTVVANNKKPAIEKFVNEFIIHNPNVIYPVQVDAFTTLTSRELVKKGQTIYVQENLSLRIAKSDLSITPTDLKKQMSLELKRHYCSSNYVQEREHLFKGLSNVGTINRIHDQDDKFITEVIIDRSSCD